MKVYVVTANERCEGARILGIYDTPEKAERARKRAENNHFDFLPKRGKARREYIEASYISFNVTEMEVE